MSIRTIANKQCYVGLETDTKPIGVNFGSEFYAYDIENNKWNVYVTYDDGTNWEIMSNSIVVNSSVLPTGAATSTKQDDIINALKQYVEADIDTGTATNGTNSTLVDTNKVNDWMGTLAEIKIGSKYYHTHILSNTEDTLTFTAEIAEAVTAGCTYKLKASVIQTNDIKSINGTSLTGSDWTAIFQSLNDDTKKGLIKSLGDIGAGENLITRHGARNDAAQTDSTQTASLIAITKGLLATMGLIKDADGIKQIRDTVKTQELPVLNKFLSASTTTISAGMTCEYFGLTNDSSSAVTYSVNNIQGILNAGEIQEFKYAPFTFATITGAATIRSWVRG